MKTFLLVNYDYNGNRMGKLSGKYICSQDTWDKLKNRKWCAYDVLGKHSEISGNFRENFSIKEITAYHADFLCEILELDIEVINKNWDDDNGDDYYPNTLTISGFNVFDYIREKEEE